MRMPSICGAQCFAQQRAVPAPERSSPSTTAMRGAPAGPARAPCGRCAARRRAGWPRRSCSRCGCRAPGSAPARAAACRRAAARSRPRGRRGGAAGPAPACVRPAFRRSGRRAGPRAAAARSACRPPGRPRRCGRPKSRRRSRSAAGQFMAFIGVHCRQASVIRKIENSDRLICFSNNQGPTMRKTPDLSTRQLRAFPRWPSSATSRARRRPATCRSRPSARSSARWRTRWARACSTATRAACSSRPRAGCSKARRAAARRHGQRMGDLADHVERRKGRVRVAALPSLAAGWLPAVFAEFMQGLAGHRIDLDDALSDACIAWCAAARRTSRWPPRARARRGRQRPAAASSAPTAFTWCAAPTIRWRASRASR
jgi:hypothetical protein